MARLKISSSLENFKILIFFKIWALRVTKPPRQKMTKFSRRLRGGGAKKMALFRPAGALGTWSRTRNFNEFQGCCWETDFLPLPSESVKCRFSKCRFSALNLKFDFISDGGCTREKQIQKALGSLPPCGNRCRFSESAICSSRVHPPSEIKSNFKFKTLRWRPLRWRLTLSDTGADAPGPQHR